MIAGAVAKECTVAIIGGGFSGTMVACHLLKRLRDKKIIIIEPNKNLGCGPAYQESSRRFLLNVPAGDMGAYPDDPGGFHQWLKEDEHTYTQDAFAPRALYGHYVQKVFEEATRSSTCSVETVISAASSCTKSQRFTITCEDGSTVAAESIVLALGNLPPVVPPAFQKLLQAHDPRVLANPWQAQLMRELKGTENLLIIGAGLTAIDLIVEAAGSGYAGNITVVSRRGYLPHAHARTTIQKSSFLKDLPEKISLLTLIKIVRNAASQAAEWRSIITELRPLSQRIWAQFSTREKRSFCTHLRPFWDMHRHRVPYESLAILENLKQERRLSVIAGRVVSCDELAGTQAPVTVGIRLRKSAEVRSYLADKVCICTGPSEQIKRSESLLIRQLLADGMSCEDALGIGFEVARSGAVVDAQGREHQNLFAIGTLRRGMLWETTAVKELREQAREIASEICARI